MTEHTAWGPTSLDPALCADGCGRLAETERPMGVTADGDYIAELVCNRCAHTSAHEALEWLADNRITFDQDMGEL